jgi:phage shock protein A
MARKYTRKLKGGDVNIAVVNETIEQLKNDVRQMSMDVDELGKKLGIMNENIPQQDVTPEIVAPEIVAPEIVAPEVVAPEVVAPEVVAPEAHIHDIKTKTINVIDNGITKQITIELLLNSIQNKITQLRKYKRNANYQKNQTNLDDSINKYIEFSNKIKAAMSNNDINEIQKIWDTKPANIVFKNDKIMGGKTKKLQQKSRRNNKTKK